jgi:hypothetical protein
MVFADGIFHDLSEWCFTLTPMISFSLASHNMRFSRRRILSLVKMADADVRQRRVSEMMKTVALK